MGLQASDRKFAHISNFRADRFVEAVAVKTVDRWESDTLRQLSTVGLRTSLAFPNFYLFYYDAKKRAISNIHLLLASITDWTVSITAESRKFCHNTPLYVVRGYCMNCMSEKYNRRSFIRNTGALSVTAATISLAGCTGAGERSYDFINHFSEGGGTDANFRQIQSYWEEELDASFTQVYEGGAGTRNGVNAVLGSGEELAVGGTLAPSTPVTTVVDEDEGREPAFSMDDVEFVGTTIRDPALIRIRGDEDRFNTLEELIEYGQDNPGELVKGSSGPVNPFSLAGALVLDAFDLDDVPIVVYDGGGPNQTALMQGEVDFAVRGVYNSRGIENESTAIGIFAEENEWPEITNDAPPVNDVLDLDLDYGPLTSFETYYVSAEAAEANPDEYDALVETFQTAMASDGYMSELESVDEFEPAKVDVRTPDETRDIWQNAVDQYGEFLSLTQSYLS